jgi:hypothetical protein
MGDMTAAAREMIVAQERQYQEALNEIDRLVDADTAKCDRIHILLNALSEIAKGKGRFSLDHFEHCKNTVEDMKELAVRAIDETKAAGELFGWSPEEQGDGRPGFDPTFGDCR